LRVDDLGSFASRICNRHYRRRRRRIAIVAEQMIANSDFQVRIFNPDGSEAGMSGTDLGARVVSLPITVFGRPTCCDSDTQRDHALLAGTIWTMDRSCFDLS